MSKGFYRSRGIRSGCCALDAASNNDTTPARASGPSSCAARGIATHRYKKATLKNTEMKNGKS